MKPSDLRQPPHCIVAEQSVIGGILLENKAYLKIANLLTDNDFYRDDHQLIFRAFADMAADNKPLDVLTVSEWMKGRFIDNGYVKRSFFEVIGGLAYLGDLAKDTPSSANIAAYANIVRQYSIRRQALVFARKLSEKAFQQGSEDEAMTDLLEFAVAGAFELDKQQQKGKNKALLPLKQRSRPTLKH